MINVKDIKINRIDSKSANNFVKKHHYSGKFVQNSQLHFGAFYEDKLHGVLSYGPSIDKKKLIGLVEGTKWNEFIELNRMAFDDFLPKNSESRCISITLKLIKKHCQHIKWVVSFADAMQCGSGTIYKACGFHLIGYSKGSMWLLPDELAKINGGPVAHRLKVQDKNSKLSKYILSETKGKNLTIENCVKQFGGSMLPGYMFRYIFFLKKGLIENLNMPILPYSTIDKLEANMYKGEKMRL